MVSYPLNYNRYINYHGSVYSEMSRSLVLPVGYDRILFDGMSNAITQEHSSASSVVRSVAGVLNKNTIRTPSVSNEAQRSNNDIDPVTDPDPSSNIVCSDDDNDDA
ncbi:unnamed protein product [Rotaria socialis]|uniref:Uncharacterized protein n=1 Tax=Rotaria socialis TaxID=392032 RepID=A0A818FG10_9BILA|nr:unnamed protein product [Rotaria socialis]CAF4514962.1 unnamed protein product [Rotaria socialis]